ncbi:MAG TPA: cation:dicarboxylase symporter family transporter, partial [Candidatus Babeliaceae bacterium]|nr:cation:dicarboxylase symporter family transporter [Candidatus Babeliaceae bacterium]
MLKKSSLLWQVLIAITLAFIVGGLSAPDARVFGIPYIQLCGFLGQLFLNAMTLLMIPLVASAIIHGISQMGKDQSFGKLGAKTFFFYILTTFLAVLTGLVFVNLIHPGASTAMPAANSPPLQLAAVDPVDTLAQIVLKLIPMNIFEAAYHGNMLGIIFFSLLFGFALAKIQSEASQMLMQVWKGIFYTLMRMTHFLMKALPLGVFFLVTKAIAMRGIGSIHSLIHFFLAVLVGLATYMFIILPLTM